MILAIPRSMFEHEMDQKGYFYHSTFGLRLMINFVVISSDLRWNRLDIHVKKTRKKAVYFVQVFPNVLLYVCYHTHLCLRCQSQRSSDF